MWPRRRKLRPILETFLTPTELSQVRTRGWFTVAGLSGLQYDIPLGLGGRVAVRDPDWPHGGYVGAVCVVLSGSSWTLDDQAVARKLAILNDEPNFLRTGRADVYCASSPRVLATMGIKPLTRRPLPFSFWDPFLPYYQAP